MSVAGLDRSVAVAAGVTALVGVLLLASAQRSLAQTPATPPIWTVPEIGALPNNAHGQQVRRGRDLVSAPCISVPRSPIRCASPAQSRLRQLPPQRRTKQFGIPVGLFGDCNTAPQGAEISIEDRLRLHTRSMNGRALMAGGPEMQDFVACLVGVAPGQISRAGVGTMPELERAVDPARGAAMRACAAA